MRGKIGRDACPGGHSAGLSLVLENEKNNGERVTTIGWVRDQSKTSVLEQTLNHVFDVVPSDRVSFTLGDKTDHDSIRSVVEAKLNSLPTIENFTSGTNQDGVFIGEIGSGEGIVQMDEKSAVGNIKFMRGALVVESQAIFSSVRANACVSKGKWMYEVTLETAGIQQLGWATRSCTFTREDGVGDSADSYAYDGHRIRKWSLTWHPYGQPWVPGDVIGCCIDLEVGEILFLRNGFSLGVAFTEVGKAEPKLPYYPAISLSQGERCNLNFGGRPFRYPVDGFKPIQAPPVMKAGELTFPALARAQYLLGCLRRLLQLDSKEFVAAMAPIDRLKRLKSLGEDSVFVGKEICKILASLFSVEGQAFQLSLPGIRADYVTWGSLVPCLMELYRFQPPHDVLSLDKSLDLLLSFLDKESARACIFHIVEALAFGCRTSPIILVDCPYTGSYPFLALACHLLHRQDFLMQWWSSEGSELCLEGLLSRKGPNKHDLEALMPTVWWPGSREDSCSENNMRQTASALSKVISKVEELQWDLSRHLLEFVPSTVSHVRTDSDSSVPEVVDKSRLIHPSGSAFMSFLRHLVSKNKGATRNMPPPGLSDNSVLVTAYTVLLRFLSEGLTSSDINSVGNEQGDTVGFLHRGGKRSFRVRLFLNSDHYVSDFARLGGTFSHLSKANTLTSEDYKDVEWEEGCTDDIEKRVTHLGKPKPCCCSGVSSSSTSCCNASARVLNKCFNVHVNSVNESIGASRFDQDTRSGNNEVDVNPSSSGRAAGCSCSNVPLNPQKKIGFNSTLSDSIWEEELLDTMVLLYHLGVAPNFKQALYYLQHQLQSITQLDDTDRQIRTKKTSSDFLKRLKEARAVCREDLIECVRRSTWYRVSLFSKWKQRGMFATCMWIVQLLLILSERDTIFSYVPEYYVETLLDCFHALRRSDPPFVSPTALLQQGLSSLITFLVTHFNDTRIANSDIRDALLQSISVLVQYKEHVVAFECNNAAIEVMPAALLSAFDNRFWIPVTNILLRLCKGSGFGASKSSTHGESCSRFFQGLLRDLCIKDEKLFSSFLNRLFNTLNWTITEFSVSIKEMQEQADQRQVADLQQRKCTIMFELSCNLERILEFFTRELPQAFLCGAEMNLIRLCELLMFVLNHTTAAADVAFFESTLRQQGQSLEKVNRAMILAPLVGIVLNLDAAKTSARYMRHDVARAIINVDASSVATRNFEYLIDFSWASTFKGDPSLARLPELKEFLEKLKAETLVVQQKQLEEDSMMAKLEYDTVFGHTGNSTREEKEDICSICYACEINTVFFPCNHKSCWHCISRHLLNSQRCFFCNATVQDLQSMSVMSASGHNAFGASGAPNGLVGESALLEKIEPP